MIIDRWTLLRIAKRVELDPSLENSELDEARWSSGWRPTLQALIDNPALLSELIIFLESERALVVRAQYVNHAPMSLTFRKKDQEVRAMVDLRNDNFLKYEMIRKLSAAEIKGLEIGKLPIALI